MMFGPLQPIQRRGVVQLSSSSTTTTYYNPAESVAMKMQCIGDARTVFLLPHFFMILGTFSKDSHFKNDRQTKEILGAERVFPLPAYTLNSTMMFFGYIFHFKNDRQTKQTLKGVKGSFPSG
jgi:hypothetical protein